ncbi:tetratricopeptide repeat protein [Pseudomonas sp. MT3]|nr:tetratricopeptide repeat protein [uncultured Pseudomonas sp.]
MKTISHAIIITLTALHITFSTADQRTSKTLEGVSGRITLDDWNDHRKAWRKLTFSDKTTSFLIYRTVSGGGDSDTLFSVSSDSLSPDGKFLILQRSEIGELYLEDGKKQETETSRCEVIEMRSGCVMQTKPSEYCSGKWSTDSKWTTSIDNAPRPARLETPSPALLNKRIASMSIDSKAVAVEDSLFMGAASYLACFPPSTSNIRDLNDIAYYLSQAGDDQQALKIYKAIEAKTPNRTVLKLNIADSLWNENRKLEARTYYKNYEDEMRKLGKERKIPPRVFERMTD